MLRPKSPKELDYSKEELIGKAIVDQKGDIIAKCTGIIEDEKKKKYMKIAIKTEIESEFEVIETIPLSLINRVGEVILLKQSFEIKPVLLEDIVKIEIPKEVNERSQRENEIIIEKKLDERVSGTIEKEKKQTMKQKSKKKSKIKEDTKEFKLQFSTFFDNISLEKNTTRKQELINELVSKYISSEDFRQHIIDELFNKMQTTDHIKRLTVFEIFKKFLATNLDWEMIFLEGLKATYNEPSFNIEELLVENLNTIASKKGIELANNSLENYFNQLFIDRLFCKNISLQRIHNINLKIFKNNFFVQEIIAEIYLKQICSKCSTSLEFTSLLSDINALIIAYCILNKYNINFWEDLRKNKEFSSIIKDSYLIIIDNITENYIKGNIKKLTEILDPKIGQYFSNKLIANMIKGSIREVLSNVSTLPLDLLCEFYFDDNNRIVQIIFDLINRQEITAEILFVEDKTYISLIQ